MSKKVLLVVMLVLCIAAGAGVFLLLQNKSRTEEMPQAGTQAESGTEMENTVTYQGETYEYNRNLRNVLFLGVDKEADSVVGETVGRNGQADCILLMIMNQETRETTLLQISRDSMTDVEIYGITGSHLATEHAQIALQYAFGESDSRSNWLTKNAVSHLLYEIPISSVMALTVDGIGEVTSAMGGVTLTVPRDYTSVDPSFTEGATLTLQGDLAERYVRYRDITVTGSNNDRMERQNQFIQAMFQQMQNIDSAAYEKLLDSAEPYLTTDLTAEELKNLKNYTIHQEIETVPGTAAPGEEHEEFTVDDQALYELILELFYIKQD